MRHDCSACAGVTKKAGSARLITAKLVRQIRFSIFPIPLNG
jgi:hypothetical protein